ncbi:uncharacterized protein LOC124420097 isoform X3 [Lucilia cuprina]|uniref:uncharacterized protein LOC124420097 isoform X3 n=1 Tax=Lucilia cuprina TaxID=7375 RepID=UPI001F052F85|nr:uncharacterized protein LOC124420097 isoform X3 [Lucilia cuprina]
MSASNETSKKKHNYSWETEDWAQVSFAPRSYQITTNPEIFPGVLPVRHLSNHKKRSQKTC